MGFINTRQVKYLSVCEMNTVLYLHHLWQYSALEEINYCSSICLIGLSWWVIITQLKCNKSSTQLWSSCSSLSCYCYCCVLLYTVNTDENYTQCISTTLHFETLLLFILFIIFIVIIIYFLSDDMNDLMGNYLNELIYIQWVKKESIDVLRTYGTKTLGLSMTQFYIYKWVLSIANRSISIWMTQIYCFNH